MLLHMTASYYRTVSKPFALLLPAYTATKSYWRDFLTNSAPSAPRDAVWIPASSKTAKAVVDQSRFNEVDRSNERAAGVVKIQRVSNSSPRLLYLMPPDRLGEMK